MSKKLENAIASGNWREALTNLPTQWTSDISINATEINFVAKYSNNGKTITLRFEHTFESDTTEKSMSLNGRIPLETKTISEIAMMEEIGSEIIDKLVMSQTNGN